MPTFLVESYEPRGRALETEAWTRAAAQAGGLTYVRSIFTPQDEVSLHIFESPSRDRLALALADAGLGEVRITEATEFPPERSRR